MESLNPEENVHVGLIGTAVDYLTRFITGTPAAEAFQFSLLGSLPVKDGLKKALELVRTVQGLDDRSISSAVKLTGFDVCCRAGSSRYKPIEGICPDRNAIQNIRIMALRSKTFWTVMGRKSWMGSGLKGIYGDGCKWRRGFPDKGCTLGFQGL